MNRKWLDYNISWLWPKLMISSQCQCHNLSRNWKCHCKFLLLLLHRPLRGDQAQIPNSNERLPKVTSNFQIFSLYNIIRNCSGKYWHPRDWTLVWVHRVLMMGTPAWSTSSPGARPTGAGRISGTLDRTSSLRPDVRRPGASWQMTGTCWDQWPTLMRSSFIRGPSTSGQTGLR